MANAIIMAAGMGTRMRPLTETTPKPLIPVKGTPMVETVLRALRNRGVEEITLVTGYLGEQFDYLAEQDSRIHIVRNPDYQTINNISSIYYARQALRQGDCFLCEADLYISDPEIFNAPLPGSCYFGKMVPGHSEDWVFDLGTDGFITRVGKVGDDRYNMVGLSYFSAEDAARLADCMEAAWGQPGFETLFWDDVVNNNLDQLKLKVQPVNPGQITEIDTVEELRAVEAAL